MDLPFYTWPLGAAVVLALAGALALPRWRRRGARWPPRLWLLGLTLLAGLAAAETWFQHFVGASDGFGITLAHRNWKRWNWGPEQFNSLRYRDVEPTPENYAGRRVLFVVGDSLVQGYGVARREDVFASAIQRGLPEGWRVASIAREGWETQDYLAALREFPLEPDAIVLSYFPNDITKTAILGLVPGHRDWLPAPPPAPWDALVARSHLVNFFYWRLYRARGAGLAGSYMDFLFRAFEDETVWRFHAGDLGEIVAFARERGAPLLVVITPFLQAVEASRPITEKVAGFFAEQGVPTLDLTPVLAGREPRELVVNANDAHPNEALHAEMGALILEALEREGMLE